MIPNEITAGDSVSWYDDAFKDNIGNDIAPGDWTLKYALRGKVTIDITASVVDGQWKSTLAPTDTVDLTSATILYWQAYATKGSDKVTLGSGQISVKPSLVDVASSSYDGRSQAKKDLDAVQAAIRAVISGGAVQRYVIGNREVQKMQLADLYQIEARLKYEVASEKRAESIAKGLGDPRTLAIKFK
jgi:hypothetical protein